MEGADPQNASGSQKKPRVDRRRKYPALKDQTTCLFELPPLVQDQDQVLSPSPIQTVPGPSRSRSRARAVRGPRRPVHAQTPTDQTGSVIGQVVEGVIDGKFQDGYLISVNIGGITMKGVAYGLVANEGQTVQQQNNNDVQIVPGTVRKIQPWSKRGNSGGGTSSNPTKHKDKGQARDVRGRGKEKV